MKYIVYYRVTGGTKVNRDYPDYPTGTDPKALWQAANALSNRRYLQHEPHDDYVAAFANMVGKDETLQRQWLEARVQDLNLQVQAAQQAKLANVIPASSSDTHPGYKPGDIVRDQFGRSGRVPQVPLETYRTKPIKPDDAMDAVRDFCKGGGGSIPR